MQYITLHWRDMPTHSPTLCVVYRGYNYYPKNTNVSSLNTHADMAIFRGGSEPTLGYTLFLYCPNFVSNHVKYFGLSDSEEWPLFNTLLLVYIRSSVLYSNKSWSTYWTLNFRNCHYTGLHCCNLAVGTRLCLASHPQISRLSQQRRGKRLNRRFELFDFEVLIRKAI
jgi:hypothetical protein